MDGGVGTRYEVDENGNETVPTARKRLNSARRPWVRGGSTPKFPASGIGRMQFVAEAPEIEESTTPTLRLPRSAISRVM